MQSVFYTTKFRKDPILSFLLMEHISIRLSESADNVNSNVISVIHECAQQCHGVSLTEEELTRLAQRLQKIAEDNNKAKDKAPGKKPSGFGKEYMKWVESLAPDQLCLMVAQYDFESAYHLYSEVDRDDVIRMAKVKLDDDWNHIQTAFESCVYGFGGGFESDKGGNKIADHEYDLSTGGAEAMAAFNKLL